MVYEKHSDYACEECRRTFKNQRALDAHNEAVHSLDLASRNRPADLLYLDRGRNPVRDGDAPDS